MPAWKRPRNPAHAALAFPVPGMQQREPCVDRESVVSGNHPDCDASSQGKPWVYLGFPQSCPSSPCALLGVLASQPEGFHDRPSLLVEVEHTTTGQLHPAIICVVGEPVVRDPAVGV